MTRPWYKSRTIIFGLLLAIASAAELLVPFLPQQYVGIVGALIAGGIIILRYLTTTPLGARDEDK